MTMLDWVEKHKRKGCEIKEINGNYYMYKLKSAWDPVRKRPKKVSGEYIGKVTPDGVIPKQQRIAVDAPIFSMEYGASALLASLCNDILQALRAHFTPDTAERIWVTAMLRLISPCPFSRVGMRYDSSWMSELVPGLALSPASISGLLNTVGVNRIACASFMRDTIAKSPYYIIDGTRTVSASDGIVRAFPGYSHSNRFLPQLNQVYIVAASPCGGIPVFYRNVAGNIPDVTALKLTLEDAQVKDATLIGDTGFASEVNFQLLDESRLSYIIPLKRNTKEINLSTIEYSEVFSYHHRAIWAHSTQRDGYRICVFRDEKLRSDEITDFVERTEKYNASIREKKSFVPAKGILRDVTGEAEAKECLFGTIVVRTSLMEAPLQKVYETYKLRGEIEQIFDTMRNACDNDTSYMHDDTGFEGWSFIGHITLMAACRLLALLREKKLSSQWSLSGLMDFLARVHAVKIGNNWRIAESTKKTGELAQKLGLNLDGQATLLPKL